MDVGYGGGPTGNSPKAWNSTAVQLLRIKGKSLLWRSAFVAILTC
jgi:hypothetical protein